MLYMIGAVRVDTMPFSADTLAFEGGSSLARKPVMGGMQPIENTGQGDETITVEGQILPTKIGGLTELEVLNEMRRRGARFPLMRGDGFRYGWYVITSMSIRHSNLMRNGVGFTVQHSIVMERADFNAGDGQQIVSSILSIFTALGR